MISGQFDVVGAHAATAFFEHLAPGDLGHGYLFSGQMGVGKKTFARRLAQALLCVTPKPGLLGYCGHCSGCTRVVAGAHPDLYIAEGQVKIGDRDGGGFHENDETTARDLVRQLSMHSYAGGRRIFILGDADFTREAANALLKFFEEPPADVLLIVTTASPGRLLATIRSRLVDLAFPPLADAEIVRVLVAEGVDRDEAQRAAEIADGSITRARGYLDGDEAALRDAAVAWFFAILEGAESDAGTWAARATLEDGLEIVKTLTRDWLALSLGSDVPLLARDQASRLRELPARDPASIARSLGALGEADRIARTNVSPLLVADLAKMALAAPPAR